jgi:hypothetical protein
VLQGRLGISRSFATTDQNKNSGKETRNSGRAGESKLRGAEPAAPPFHGGKELSAAPACLPCPALPWLAAPSTAHKGQFSSHPNSSMVELQSSSSKMLVMC